MVITSLFIQERAALIYAPSALSLKWVNSITHSCLLVFKLLPLCWSSEWVCEKVSAVLRPIAPRCLVAHWLSQTQTLLILAIKYYGISFSDTVALNCGALRGLRTPHSSGVTSIIKILLLILNYQIVGLGPTLSLSLPPILVLTWFPLYIFIYKNYA